MADVDTSSYVKPGALPVQKSMLEQAKQYGDMEQQKLSIDRNKLAYYNEQYQVMTDELSSLANDKNTTPQEVVTRLERRLKAINAQPKVIEQMRGTFANMPPGALGDNGTGNPTLSRQLDIISRQSQDANSRVNRLYGSPGSVDDGQATTPTRTGERGGPVPSGAPIQRQLPVGTNQVDNRRTLPDGSANPDFGQSVMRGPQPPALPPGATPVQGGLPSQYEYKLPIAKPQANTGVTPEATSNNQVVENRFGPATSLAPGVAEAASGAGTAAGVQLAAERNKAANFQRDIFPLAQAIPALEKLGTKGTGPGTETLNHVKSFVLSNVPGVKESDFGFGTVKDFDKAKKYLTDFVNQTGNSGTNDKLAAAFAGNPSVGISNAAAVDVAKAAMALRRMQQSKYLAFEDSNQQPDQASKFFANGTINYEVPGPEGTLARRSIKVSQIDPRAFGIDVMTDKAKKSLLEQLNKNPREKELFDRSLEIAMSHGYLVPK